MTKLREKVDQKDAGSTTDEHKISIHEGNSESTTGKLCSTATVEHRVDRRTNRSLKCSTERRFAVIQGKQV